MRRAVDLVLLLTGCAQYQWAKPGATEADLKIVTSHCEALALQDFPPLLRTELVAAGYTTPLVTTCQNTANRIDCVSKGGDFVPPRFRTVDDNEDRRERAVDACRIEAGWTRYRLDGQTGRWIPAP